MAPDYGFDLEPPVDDSPSANQSHTPRYDDELQALYQMMSATPGIDSDFSPDRDSEEIDAWEEVMNLAHYQFAAVPQVVEVDQSHAEKLFDTGELLVYKLLDDFENFHIEYYNQFESKADPRAVTDLRDAYQDAYDSLNDHGDAFADGNAFGGSGAFEADEDYFGGGDTFGSEGEDAF